MRTERKRKYLWTQSAFSHGVKANVLGKARTFFTCHSVINVRKPRTRVETSEDTSTSKKVLRESRCQQFLVIAGIVHQILKSSEFTTGVV